MTGAPLDCGMKGSTSEDCTLFSSTLNAPIHEAQLLLTKSHRNDTHTIRGAITSLFESERSQAFLFRVCDVEELVESGDREDFFDLLAEIAQDKFAAARLHFLVQNDQLIQRGT